jgi:hypothetical protein
MLRSEGNFDTLYLNAELLEVSDNLGQRLLDICASLRLGDFEQAHELVVGLLELDEDVAELGRMEANDQLLAWSGRGCGY